MLTCMHENSLLLPIPNLRGNHVGESVRDVTHTHKGRRTDSLKTCLLISHLSSLVYQSPKTNIAQLGCLAGWPNSIIIGISMVNCCDFIAQRLVLSFH